MHRNLSKQILFSIDDRGVVVGHIGHRFKTGLARLYGLAHPIEQIVANEHLLLIDQQHSGFSQVLMNQLEKDGRNRKITPLHNLLLVVNQRTLL